MQALGLPTRIAYLYPFKNAEEQTKLAVWAKGRIIPNQNGNNFRPEEWRHDSSGFPIRYSDHGNTNSEYGWEIDHIKPKAGGGTDSIENLQPLQWNNNRTKGDNYPAPTLGLPKLGMGRQ